MLKGTSVLQILFETQMARKYCPDSPAPGDLRDPILHVWRSPNSGLLKASHLFPSRQANFMNTIFGQGAREDFFSPCNDLFLHPLIEKTLHRGFIAIVPDVELDDMQPWWDVSNLSQSIQVLEWDKLHVKDYKVIVVDERSSRIRQLFANGGADVFKECKFLDGRKLIFKTEYRPQIRYVWWTYLNAVLYTEWSCEESCIEKNEEDLERVTQYWRTYGRYAKRNQIRGLIEHIDHRDVQDFLNEGYAEDDDIEDARPEAVEALLLEVIARSEDDGDDDYHSDDED
ncbi:hypothetical protein FSPOR_4178 [Fusarium sporotrichioides]|uniref:HNH nuclease domain-containing protein n=1 Tax=Fusarium sporotrichioides TaxID=5514 RepID=A0A395SCZ4_FUSSP|nr:hypothetical protein FSPOR_4178 [Fusarium sporotrichioides]